MAHPEIDRQFTTMHSTPYSAGDFTYNVDWADVTEIRFNQRWNKYGMRYRISDVELLEGPRKKGPDYLSYGARRTDKH